MDEDDNHITCKVVLVGESGVGKTCIITQYIDGKFETESPTSAATFTSKIVNFEKQNIKFDIWDTAGQEIYRSIGKIFYKEAKVIILVYDITDKKSFQEIKDYWYKQVIDNAPSEVNKF